MGTNLGLFRHLFPSKSTTYHPPPHGRITSGFPSLMTCLSCHPNVCCPSESLKVVLVVTEPYHTSKIIAQVDSRPTLAFFSVWRVVL